MPVGTDIESVRGYRKKKQEMLRNGMYLESANDEFFEKLKTKDVESRGGNKVTNKPNDERIL